MVALKPGRWNAICVVRASKQERRGGIETSSGPTVVSSSPVKQERRGGIETDFLTGNKEDHPDEAGTPWWH